MQREEGRGKREEKSLKRKTISTRRGLTVLELLVTALILSVLMLAAFALFKTSWQSYDNLVWQTKVNMEARQSLDDICDLIRMSGNDVDMIRPTTMTEGQVDITSRRDYLSLLTAGLGNQNYRVQRSNRDNVFYMVRRQGLSVNPLFNVKVGQFLSTVQLEYEYRLPATSDTDAVWRFERYSPPGTRTLSQANPTAAFLATTVYVTVTAEVQPYANGTIYRRTMTGAVSLRGPHGLTMPPAQYSDLPQQPDPEN